MKKIILLAIFSTVLAVTASAQFRFGLHVSPTWTWIRTDDKFLETAGANWGAKIGVFGEKYFQDNYAIATGIGFGFNHGGFVQNSYNRYRPWINSDLTVPLAEFDTLSLPINSKLHYRLTYVEIPFSLKMRGGSNEDSPLRFFAEAPMFTLGFVTKAQGDILGAGTRFDTNDEQIRDDVKGLSLAWGFGGGVEYELASRTTLVGGLYYQNQFTDISAKARAQRTSADGWIDEKAKSVFRGIALRIGVIF